MILLRHAHSMCLRIMLGWGPLSRCTTPGNNEEPKQHIHPQLFAGTCFLVGGYYYKNQVSGLW